MSIVRVDIQILNVSYTLAMNNIIKARFHNKSIIIR